VIEELTARTYFLDEAIDLLLFVELKQLDDVRVIHLAEDVDLVEEAI
jgi:hypothetical protein